MGVEGGPREPEGGHRPYRFGFLFIPVLIWDPESQFVVEILGLNKAPGLASPYERT